MLKKVKNLEIGDIVITADDRPLKIKNIDKGWFTKPSKLIIYTNGEWSCYENNEEVEVKETSKV